MKEILDKIERDIVYARLEASTCEKKDLKFWAGYLAHCKELKKELLSESKMKIEKP